MVSFPETIKDYTGKPHKIDDDIICAVESFIYAL